MNQSLTNCKNNLYIIIYTDFVNFECKILCLIGRRRRLCVGDGRRPVSGGASGRRLGSVVLSTTHCSSKLAVSQGCVSCGNVLHIVLLQ